MMIHTRRRHHFSRAVCELYMPLCIMLRMPFAAALRMPRHYLRHFDADFRDFRR